MTRSPESKSEQQRYLKTRDIYSRLAEKKLSSLTVYHADDIVRTIENHKVYGTLIIEYIDGTPLDQYWKQMTDEDRTQFALDFADYIKNVHSIEYSAYGSIKDGTQVNSWQDYIIKRSEEAIDQLMVNSYFSSTLLNKAIEFLIENTECWQYRFNPKLIHSDLWPGNIIIADTTFYLIDWEWAFAGDPFYDLLWIEELFMNEQPYVDLFLNSYGIDQEEEDMRKRCLNVYASLTTCAFGWVHHNPDKESFERQQELIRQNIDSR